MNISQSTLQNPDLSALDLHREIVADDHLGNTVLTEAKRLHPRVDSLPSAIIILGVNTVKNIALNAGHHRPPQP